MKRLKQILLVDDDDTSNFLHQDLLETMQVAEEILICSSALQAWELLQQHHPDLILLDINMPGMSGLEFLSQLYPLEKRSCPVVLLTSSGHPKDISQAADLHVDYYLLKPLTETTLTHLLEYLFGTNQKTIRTTNAG